MIRQPDPTRLVPPPPSPGPAVHQRCAHQASRQGLQGCRSTDAAAPHSHACHWIPPGRRTDGPDGRGPRRLPPSVNTPTVLGAWGCAPPCCWWGGGCPCGCAPDTSPCRVPCTVHTPCGGCCNWGECSVRRASHGASWMGGVQMCHMGAPPAAHPPQSTPPQYGGAEVPPPAAVGVGGAPAGMHLTQPPAGYPAQFKPSAGAAAKGPNAV